MGGDGAAGPTTRGATTVSAMGLSATVLDVTITLLTSLPLRGSVRTTEVMCFDGTGASVACRSDAATIPPIHIVKQKRITMFPSGTDESVPRRAVCAARTNPSD